MTRLSAEAHDHETLATGRIELKGSCSEKAAKTAKRFEVLPNAG